MMNKNDYTNHAKAWQYVEQQASSHESEVLRQSRKTAQEAGLSTCTPAEAQVLNVLTRMMNDASIIMIGTGALVETAQLADGLRNTGKLTVVDSSAAGIDMVKELFNYLQEETPTTLRAVNAKPEVFLQRLNGDTYDLMVVNGDAGNYRPAYEQASRLLKKGGVLLLMDALCMESPDSKGGLPNAADRSPKTVMMRELLKPIQEDEAFTSTLTPVGNGLLIAVKN